MRVVIALGGNALPLPLVGPRLGAVAQRHQLVLACGLGRAESIELELAVHLPPGTAPVTVLTTLEVDHGDPAFAAPSTFVGPAYAKPEADRLARERGWCLRPDGRFWRRVLPSPQPQRLAELRPLTWLLQRQTVIVCALGKPAVYQRSPRSAAVGGRGSAGHHDVEPAAAAAPGIEAVVDEDLAAEVIAREIDADLLVLATDIDGVYRDWGTPRQRLLDRVTPRELRGHSLPAASMGPKAEAAARFAELTRRRAAIGSLSEVDEVVNGRAGTQVLCCGHRN